MAIWKYRLEKSVTITIMNPKILERYSRINRVIYTDWATITISPHYINVIVREGYAWDGCSPKWKVDDFILGIWDGFYDAKTHYPQTYYASLVHDVLCQFFAKHPLSLRDVDLVFLWLLRDNRFFFAVPYYYFVRLWHKTLSPIKSVGKQ